jgi:hypothetical protein
VLAELDALVKNTLSADEYKDAWPCDDWHEHENVDACESGGAAPVPKTWWENEN